jgi:hypothetical protein
MIFDEDLVYSGLLVGMVNLVVVIGISSAVVRTLLRQRAIENAFRLRMARWRQQTRDAGQ